MLNRSFINCLNRFSVWMMCVIAIGVSSLKAAEPIKVLMLGDNGHHRPSDFFRHVVGPLSNYGIELTYTESLSDINTANLANYKGLLIFANTDRIDPETEKALLDFVNNGGGLIPVHCASYCFLNSDKYIELVGGQFKSHGYTRFSTQVVNPTHEIMQGYKPFSSYDESYMHTRHNPDKVVLEVRSSDSGPVSEKQGEPYTWVRTSGEGRVFYTAWGHNYRTWESPAFQDLLARGTRWACKQPVLVEQAVAPDKSVAHAEAEFSNPEMVPPTLNDEGFTYTDVGAKIPNYTPSDRWGVQGAAFTLMQDPVPAETSVKALSFPKGFSLSIWAKEMDKYWPAGSQPKTVYSGLGGKPIAMNWDERGRLWVCETTDYPNNLESTNRGADRIRICEDTDNDGHADKFTVFAEKMSIPTTLVCYAGGVIVQDGQTTVFLKDTNGDDKADFRQELVTGWAMGDTHGGVSNFLYGPDNWIWGMQGYNDSRPVINGKATQAFRQGFFRFAVKRGASDKTAPAYEIDQSNGNVIEKPTNKFDEHTIRVTDLEFIRATTNNTWGLGFSEEGYVFGSTANHCPSVHMPIPNKYYDNVAGWSPETVDLISDNYKFNPIDKKIRQVDQHGGYTAAAGHSLYTARTYPQEWWNKIGFVCEPTGHIVGSFVMQRRGAGYQSHNLFNLVASYDDWCAPIMAEVGPDGNVWVLDWYNYIIQHNPVPNGFENGRGNAYESDLRDKRFGRVYRVQYGEGPSASSTMNLANADSAKLVAALSSDNMFWRKTAQRLIVEKQLTDAATLEQLVNLVKKPTLDAIGLDVAAMHAIWTLSGLVTDTSKPEAVAALKAACEAGFVHPSGPVRHAAVQSCPADILKIANEKGLLNDRDSKVQLAMLLRAAENQSGSAIESEKLAGLTRGNTSVFNDEILADAWTAAAAAQPIDVIVSLSKQKSGITNMQKERIAIIAEHFARSNPDASAVEKLLSLDPSSPIALSVWQGLAKGWPRNLQLKLSKAGQSQLLERFLADSVPIENKAAVLTLADKWGIENLAAVTAGIQDGLVKVALDSSVSTDQRGDAWSQAILLGPSSPSLATAAESLLVPQTPSDLTMKVISALQNAKVEGLADALIEQRKKLTPQLASKILTMLLARTDTTKELIAAIADGRVQFSELQLDQRQALTSHPNKEIAAKAAELLKSRGAAVTSNRQSLVDDWMSVTKMSGDVTNGIAMYKKHCALCHVHGDMGVGIGPNLTGMAVHPKEELLIHILDPSRSVEGNFRTYQILTVDGEVVTGMLAGESQNSIRVINSQAKEQQVLREDIEEMNASTKSLMPEGFESLMTKQEFSDLLTFLTKRGKYTTLPIASAATVSSALGLFNDKDDPGEAVVFDDWSPKKFHDVPFIFEDPQDGRKANLIMLRSPNGKAAAAMPTETSLPVSGAVKAIHLLGGVGGWAYPFDPNQSVSMIVRCNYEDGTTKEYPLHNGKEIADYIGRVDVPGSEYAFDMHGRQLRYLKIEIDSSKPLKSIDFAKGEDRVAPMVFAVTVEAVGEGH